MNSALYDPQHGFYTQGPAIGTHDGEFNTNAMFPAFAYAVTLAIQQAETLIGEQLRVVELGGGTGELGENITSFSSSPREYVVIETSPNLRKQQEKRGLSTLDRVELLPPAPTFVIGNEVLDALPIHRVMSDGSGQLLEFYVELDEHGEFAEQPGPLSSPLLAQRLQNEKIHLGRGQVAEICLELEEFLKSIQRFVSKGYILLIDYGDEAPALYAHTKRNGTLRSFHSQKQTFDPFDAVGEQDLTADVDFSAVRQAALNSAFVPMVSLQQGTWLTNIGIEKYLEKIDNSQKARLEITQLTNQAYLGSTFEVRIFKTQGLPDGLGLHFSV